MSRVTIKIGDIFCANVDDANKMYFQYVTDDLTQLNAVVTVFATKHPKDEPVNFEQIAQGQVLFYAHTVINRI